MNDPHRFFTVALYVTVLLFGALRCLSLSTRLVLPRFGSEDIEFGEVEVVLSMSAAASSSSSPSLTTTFASFLRSSRTAFLKSARTDWIFVGNEAGDADSIVSALAMGFYAHAIGERSVVSVASVRSAGDFALRRDVAVLLEKSGVGIVPKDDLVFLDDVRRGLQDGYRVGLLDHNALSKDYDLDANAVSLIVDHHREDNAHPSVDRLALEVSALEGVADVEVWPSPPHDATSGRGNVNDPLSGWRDVRFDANAMRGVGSCCTLVSQYILGLEGAKGELIRSERALLTMLLGVVLLDTSNLSPTAGKTTPTDVAVARQLLGAIDRDDAWANDLYKDLCDAKFDPAFWKSLSPADALRFDYKQFSAQGASFGSSAVLTRLDTFLPDELLKAASARMTERSLDFFLVLGLTVDPTPSRELMIIGPSPPASSSPAWRLARSLERNDALRLKTSFSRHGFGLTAQAYAQGNAKASRKQVVPICIDALLN